MNIGDNILYKGREAFVSDKWNPHLLNPSIFNNGEIEYAIVTKDDSRTHILCKADEKYMKIHNS